MSYSYLLTDNNGFVSDSSSTGPLSFSALAPGQVARGTANFGADGLHGYLSTVGSLGVQVIESDIENMDFVKFYSTTLPVGTPVDVQVTVLLHDSFTFTQQAISFNGGSAACGDPTGVPVGTVLLSASGFSDIIDSTCNPLPTSAFSRTTVLHTATTACTGDPAGCGAPVLELSEIIGLTARSTLGVSSIVDVSDTAEYYIQVLTPGVNYATSSGARYDPPTGTPEPSTMSLMTLCLSGLILAGRFGSGMIRLTGTKSS